MSDLKGFAELDRRLKSLSSDVQTKIGQSANRAGAVVIARVVKRNAKIGPTPEGAIRKRRRKGGAKVESAHRKIVNSIKVRKTRNLETTKVQNTIAIYAPQASWEEFGSIHNKATHFMEKSVDEAKPNALGAMAKTLNKRLTRAGV